ncbi:alkaline phosphatase family protein [Joostella sp. CR20]|uniref:alkaline phosphatase family protein n=1 Tax=Joostella sp. CR20 TaxID=2804312 RepID=UPI00313BD7ED
MNLKKQLVILCFAITSITVAQNKKAVFIIVDGIAPDMLEKTATPNLDKLKDIGSFTEAYVGGGKDTYTETPTISAVGYNSLLTGTWVHKHNVFGNSIKKPNYNYPTIYRLFKDQYPAKKTAIFSTWLDNRTKLVGENLEATRNIKVDFAFDGFELDTVNFPHDKARQFIKNIDTKVATKAADYIKENAPDLSWVYLEFSDDMGHGYGDSKQLYDAITFEDELIGKVLEAVEYREANTDEEWLLVITTDHGRSEKDGKHHGGQTYRERSTWIATNYKNTNEYFKNYTPGIVDILPTLTDFLNIEVPEDTQYEWDGVSLITPVDAINLKGSKKKNTINLQWNNISNSNEEAEILISTTNQFNSGGKDNYISVGKTKLSAEKFSINTKDIPSDFYKVVLKTKNNTLNTWILK